MHELHLSEEIVRAVLAEMSRLAPATTLKQARVVVGALRGVTPESLSFAYEIRTKNTPVAGSSLEVTIVPAKVACRDCGWQGELTVDSSAEHHDHSHHQLFICPQCEKANLETLQGMELYLSGLEVEDQET